MPLQSLVLTPALLRLCVLVVHCYAIMQFPVLQSLVLACYVCLQSLVLACHASLQSLVLACYVCLQSPVLMHCCSPCILSRGILWCYPAMLSCSLATT